MPDLIALVERLVPHRFRWYRLRGHNPGSMFAPEDSPWVRGTESGELSEFLEKSGRVLVSTDSVTHRPPWHEREFSRPHYTLEAKWSLWRPR